MSTLVADGIKVALQDVIVKVLNEISTQNAAMKDKIKDGAATQEDMDNHHSYLMQLIRILVPTFGVIMEIVSEIYEHLKSIVNWIKDLWHSIFG